MSDTSKITQDALEAYKSADLDKALRFAVLALTKNPNDPEACAVAR